MQQNKPKTKPKKAAAEQNLMKCIDDDKFSRLHEHVETANGVIASLNEPNSMQQNDAEEWRKDAVRFLELIRDEVRLSVSQ